MADEDKERLGWCICEQLGHKKMAGFVQEDEIAGFGVLRVDVFTTASEGVDPSVPVATQYINPATLYALTPTTEELARRFGDHARPVPVSRYELPAPAVTAPSAPTTDWSSGDIGYDEPDDAVEEDDDEGEWMDPTASASICGEHEDRIRAWVDQGRTDTWIAHQIEVPVSDVTGFIANRNLDADEVRDDDEHEVPR